jgi:hypothetical protein
MIRIIQRLDQSGDDDIDIVTLQKRERRVKSCV